MATGTNLQVAQFDTRALLNLLRSEIMEALHSQKIGIVDSFDASTLTVNAKLVHKKEINGKLQDYPPQVDCPVVILGGGDASIEFPIKAGDECLLLYNDEDFDRWFASGQVIDAATGRRHAFQDAFALVGIRSLLNGIDDYDAIRARFRNGLTGVAVSPSHVKIYNATTTLNTQLQALTTALTAFVSTLEALPPTAPVLGAALVAPALALHTALTAFGTQVGGLLE
jgi:hypothetical protein